MDIRAEEISQIIRQQIKDFDKKVELSETGTVLSVGDGIARVYGVEKTMAMELLEFPGGIYGVALNLEEDNVGCAILGEDFHIKEGDTVKRTGRIAEVPVGEAVLGRVIDAVGEPIDGKGPINAKEFRKIELKAPGVIEREPVKEPMYTGYKAIDAMTPIGRGQRELIIGDRQIGKTALCVLMKFTAAMYIDRLLRGLVFRSIPKGHNVISGKFINYPSVLGHFLNNLLQMSIQSFYKFMSGHFFCLAGKTPGISKHDGNFTKLPTQLQAACI